MSTDSQALQQHKFFFSSVLRNIPCAAEAMQTARTLRPAPPPTVFILDWDDTCCATSYLERCGFMADLDTRFEDCAPQLARFLRILEHRVLTLLKTATKLGTVLIVTNAGDGWVELSSSRFLPAVRAYLLAHHKTIKIVSARARYVDAYRQHPLQWKALTFTDELRPLYEMKQNPYMHVISLGDSVGDQYASHVAAERMTSAGMPIVLKVVKFLERPSIDQLCKELSVLLDHLYAMTMYKGSFDVSMYKDVSPAAPQQQSNNAQPSAVVGQSHAQPAIPVSSTNEQRMAAASNVAPNVLESQHAAMSPVASAVTCAAAV